MCIVAMQLASTTLTPAMEAAALLLKQSRLAREGYQNG
jgi:hypothetical protein